MLPATGGQMGLTQLNKQSVNLMAGLTHILYSEEQIARHRDKACNLDAFPVVTRTEYLSRCNRSMNYRFLPAALNCQLRRN